MAIALPCLFSGVVAVVGTIVGIVVVVTVGVCA